MWITIGSPDLAHDFCNMFRIRVRLRWISIILLGLMARLLTRKIHGSEIVARSTARLVPRKIHGTEMVARSTARLVRRKIDGTEMLACSTPRLVRRKIDGTEMLARSTARLVPDSRNPLGCAFNGSVRSGFA